MVQSGGRRFVRGRAYTHHGVERLACGALGVRDAGVIEPRGLFVHGSQFLLPFDKGVPADAVDDENLAQSLGERQLVRIRITQQSVIEVKTAGEFKQIVREAAALLGAQPLRCSVEIEHVVADFTVVGQIGGCGVHRGEFVDYPEGFFLHDDISWLDGRGGEDAQSMDGGGPDFATC